MIIYTSFFLQLDDGSLLSLFYYCDIAVNHQMQELNNLMRTSPDDLDRRYIATIMIIFTAIDINLVSSFGSYYYVVECLVGRRNSLLF